MSSLGSSDVQTVNLDVNQGNSYNGLLTFTDGSNVPIDVSNWTFASQIRVFYDSPVIVTSFTFSKAGLATNQVMMMLSPAQTSALPELPSSQQGEKNINLLSYDLKTTLPDGTVYTIQEGAINVNPAVTQ